jgi:hypothetical protein
MTDCRLPDNDSVLHNVWEEFCVQVQGKQAIAWESYLDIFVESLRAVVAWPTSSTIC